MKRRNFLKTAAAVPIIGVLGDTAEAKGKGCNVNGEVPVGSLGLARVVKLAKKGDRIPGHTHNFDHTTFFMLGRVRVIGWDGDERKFERVFESPNFFEIKANIRHELIAETDNCEAWCVFNHRDKDGRVTDQYSEAVPNAYV